VEWKQIGRFIAPACSIGQYSALFRTRQTLKGEGMRIHVGCELSFEFPQTTPMIATLSVHFSRASELERPDYLITNPSVPTEGYRDSLGNWCSRLVAPSGHFSLGTDAIIRDSGMSDPIDLNALQHQVQHLPPAPVKLVRARARRQKRRTNLACLLRDCFARATRSSRQGPTCTEGT
jgi:hypothetical protein